MEEKTLDIVLDVKVKVTVQLGSCLLPMRDVLELSPGSVVQLNQQASDPVGLYVNDKLVWGKEPCSVANPTTLP